MRTLTDYENGILEDMKLVRKLDSMNSALRAQLEIPRSQELKNFAYGVYYDDRDGVRHYAGDYPFPKYYLDQELRNFLGKCVEMHDFGYDFGDRMTYMLDNSFEPPTISDDPIARFGKWEVIYRDGHWFALDIRITDRLREAYEKRREHRKEMQARKEAGLQPA